MKKLILIAALSLVATPAFAKGKSHGHGHGNAWGHVKQAWKNKHDAPLPLAAGLPALVLMGGAVAMAGRARRSSKD